MQFNFESPIAPDHKLSKNFVTKYCACDIFCKYVYSVLHSLSVFFFVCYIFDLFIIILISITV